MQLDLPWGRDNEDLIDVHYAARLLGVTPRTVGNYRRDRLITSVAITRKTIRYSRRSIQNLIASRAQPAQNFLD